MLSTTLDPENRLVARTLEKHWEQALEAEETLKMEYARFVAREPAVLSAEQREAIRRLSSDIPALWHAPTTTAVDRQAIIRQLLERVIVTVVEDTEQVKVELHWAGGHRTRTRLIRPVARLEQLSYYPQLTQRVMELHQQGLPARATAQRLNTEGWRPAKRRETFAARAEEWVACGASLVGGCCRTGPEHIRQIRRRLSFHHRS